MPKRDFIESVTAENRHRDQTKDESQRYEEWLDCAMLQHLIDWLLLKNIRIGAFLFVLVWLVEIHG